MLQTTSGREVQITAAVRLPVGLYQRLVRLAERRGYVRGDRLNLSEATREAVDAGLDVLEKDQEVGA